MWAFFLENESCVLSCFAFVLMCGADILVALNVVVAVVSSLRCYDHAEREKRLLFEAEQEAIKHEINTPFWVPLQHLFLVKVLPCFVTVFGTSAVMSLVEGWYDG